jgi:hypothetical protein
LGSNAGLVDLSDVIKSKMKKNALKYPKNSPKQW